MQTNPLLAHIWQGKIVAPQDQDMRQAKRLLNLLLPFPSLCLSAKGGVARSCILPDTLEVMAGLSLGDVLAVELDLEVPKGAYIAIFKQPAGANITAAIDLSYALGQQIGDALLEVIWRGGIALNQESDALYIMANAYCHQVAGARFRCLGLQPARFRAGLSRSLREYWLGADAPRLSGVALQMHSGFREAQLFANRLNSLQSPPARALVSFDKSGQNRKDWLNFMLGAVRSELASAAVDQPL